jgi:hypothetical protein
MASSLLLWGVVVAGLAGQVPDPLEQAPAGKALMDQARKAVEDGDLKDGLSRAQAAHEAAPGDRDPLEFLAAFHDAYHRRAEAEEAHKKLRALPAVPPEPPPAYDVVAEAKPGEFLFLRATSVKLHEKPDRDSREVVSLPINTQVQVLGEEAGWAHVEAPTARPGLKVAPRAKGYMQLALLSKDPAKLDDVVKHARGLLAGGDASGASRELERALAMGDRRPETLQDLRAAAVRGFRYRLAAETALKLDLLKMAPLGVPAGVYKIEDEEFYVPSFSIDAGQKVVKPDASDAYSCTLPGMHQWLAAASLAGFFLGDYYEPLRAEDVGRACFTDKKEMQEKGVTGADLLAGKFEQLGCSHFFRGGKDPATTITLVHASDFALAGAKPKWLGRRCVYDERPYQPTGAKVVKAAPLRRARHAKAHVVSQVAKNTEVEVFYAEKEWSFVRALGVGTSKEAGFTKCKFKDWGWLPSNTLKKK